MSDSDLPAATEDYLKVIWTSQEWSDEPISSRGLAERIGHSPSTVSETLKRLTAQGLVDHERYGAVALTEQGRAVALAMVRRHRLIETFLVDYLGYGWHEVHDEAEVLEHAVSDAFVERLAERLDHPERDPHGDPIPTAGGRVPTLRATCLEEVAAPATVRVARVSDADPDLLQYLTDTGVGLDAVLTVVERRDFAGTLAVRVDGRDLDLGLPAARALFVVPAQA